MDPVDPATTAPRASGPGAVARAPAPASALPARGTGPVRGVDRMRAAGRTTRRVLRNRGDVLLVISVGGALGSLARWGAGQALAPVGAGFPLGTVVVNVTGCLLIGALTVAVMEVWPPSRYLRPFLGTGFLGGYTTFSAAMLDMRDLIVGGPVSEAGAYLAVTLIGGLVAVWLGVVGTRAAVLGARRVRARRRGARTSARGAPRGPAAEPEYHRRPS
ncbi:MAG: CrcB family protein [Kineosporiaceae bacterium]|jgi:fluoride exporter